MLDLITFAQVCELCGVKPGLWRPVKSRPKDFPVPSFKAGAVGYYDRTQAKEFAAKFKAELKKIKAEAAAEELRKRDRIREAEELAARREAEKVAKKKSPPRESPDYDLDPPDSTDGGYLESRLVPPPNKDGFYPEGPYLNQNGGNGKAANALEQVPFVGLSAQELKRMSDAANLEITTLKQALVNSQTTLEALQKSYARLDDANAQMRADLDKLTRDLNWYQQLVEACKDLIEDSDQINSRAFLTHRVAIKRILGWAGVVTK